MKLCRCPICHSNIHLDAITNDEAAKEVLSLLAPMDGGFARAIVAYLALFRPAKSDLSFSRALKLANEVLQLSNNKDWLRAALEQTISQIQATRAQGQARPLTNHNYLKKVLEGISAGAVAVAPVPTNTKAKPSMEVKSHSQPESLAETTAKWQQQMAKFLKPESQTKGG